MIERNEIPSDMKNYISYEPKSGKAFWSVDYGRRIKRGTEIKTINNGYYVVSFRKVQYLLHRVIWFIKTGEQPGYIIDHKNRNRLDNSWSNLRLVTFSQSSINTKISTKNTSGYKGVYFRKNRNSFVARIGSGKDRKIIGHYKTAYAAGLAYDFEAYNRYGKNYPDFNVIIKREK